MTPISSFVFRRRMLFAAVFLLLSLPVSSQASGARRDALADSVKQEFLHAWQGYKQYAWGHDALKPLSKTPYDWYGQPLLLTPVDALDAMLIMGLKEEARETKQLILDSLRLDRDIYVSNFEITLRLLGSLLSIYQMDPDPRFLRLAEDLGNRLMPAFGSPTGLPYQAVNLKTGAVKGTTPNPAETGTLLIEFGMLSKLTGNPKYYAAAKRALVETYKRRSKIGLVGTSINCETGEWTDTRSHIGGMIDSYYEYMLKAWLLFGDEDCKQMWQESIGPVNTYLADTVKGGLWYGVVDMHTGERRASIFGSLDAFFPAVLVLGGDMARAQALQASCYAMWTQHDIEPERYDYRKDSVVNARYYLRPEIIESAYYLYHATDDEQYRMMGRTMFESLKKFCRCEAGYAELQDVRTKEKRDAMESFFFAETLKYFYLLFAEDSALDFDSVIFTTEAHPMRKTFR